MSNGNIDRNSPYYWGTDATYRPNVVPRTPARNTAPQYTIGLDGIPVLVQSSAKPARTNNKQPQAPASNTYEVSGVTYDLPSGRAINPRTGKPSPNGYSINPSTGNRTDNPSPLSSPTRDVPKPDGSRGTQTSPGGAAPIMGMADVDALYSRLGLGSYSSPNQPQQQQTTRGIGPVIDGQIYGQMLEGSRGTRGVGPVADGQTYATNLSAVNDNVYSNPDISSQRLRDALNDTESMRGESTMSAGDRARYAFLDSEDSLLGLRERDRALGGVRARGKYYAPTDEGFTEVSDKAVKDYSANRITGRDFKEMFMNPNPVTTPAEAQSPDSINPVAVSSQPNKNLGPVIDGEVYGRQLEAQQGMRGMGPLADGGVYGEFLDGREPMMRFPRGQK
jgi:hypothetical protein